MPPARVHALPRGLRLPGARQPRETLLDPRAPALAEMSAIRPGWLIVLGMCLGRCRGESLRQAVDVVEQVGER